MPDMCILPPPYKQTPLRSFLEQLTNEEKQQARSAGELVYGGGTLGGGINFILMLISNLAQNISWIHIINDLDQFRWQNKSMCTPHPIPIIDWPHMNTGGANKRSEPSKFYVGDII